MKSTSAEQVMSQALLPAMAAALESEAILATTYSGSRLLAGSVPGDNTSSWAVSSGSNVFDWDPLPILPSAASRQIATKTRKRP